MSATQAQRRVKARVTSTTVTHPAGVRDLAPARWSGLSSPWRSTGCAGLLVVSRRDLAVRRVGVSRSGHRRHSPDRVDSGQPRSVLAAKLTVSCSRTSVTVLDQDIGDILGGRGGDSSRLAVAAPEPIDPRVRLAIARWPDDAPRGAVSTFCAEHGISRKSFYEFADEPRSRGQAAVLEPRSRRPRSSPSRLSDQVKDQALQVRAAFRGLRAGPRPDQRARQDTGDGPAADALGGVVDSDLPVAGVTRSSRGVRGLRGSRRRRPGGKIPPTTTPNAFATGPSPACSRAS